MEEGEVARENSSSHKNNTVVVRCSTPVVPYMLRQCIEGEGGLPSISSRYHMPLKLSFSA